MRILGACTHACSGTNGRSAAWPEILNRRVTPAALASRGGQSIARHGRSLPSQETHTHGSGGNQRSFGPFTVSQDSFSHLRCFKLTYVNIHSLQMCGAQPNPEAGALTCARRIYLVVIAGGSSRCVACVPDPIRY